MHWAISGPSSGILAKLWIPPMGPLLRGSIGGNRVIFRIKDLMVFFSTFAPSGHTVQVRLRFLVIFRRLDQFWKIPQARLFGMLFFFSSTESFAYWHLFDKQCMQCLFLILFSKWRFISHQASEVYLRSPVCVAVFLTRSVFHDFGLLTDFFPKVVCFWSVFWEFGLWN